MWQAFWSLSAKLDRTAVAATAVGTSLAASWAWPRAADSCGIVAYVGENPVDPAVQYLLEGLTILQNRGYDSCGISTINVSQELTTTKFASSADSTSDSIKLLSSTAPSKHIQSKIGIAHTRWATHGGKTDANAHPHLDAKNRIALVHNGTIENANDLRMELQEMGMTFKSETDSEVIAVLIGCYIDEGLETLDAITKALGRLQGTWGLCILDSNHPDQIIAARNGSPLVVGIAEGRMFIASEFSAFGRHTNQYIPLRDGEVAVVKADSVSLDKSRQESAPKCDDILLSPHPYPHWTIREINEQPEAISRALSYGGRINRGTVKLGGLQANQESLSEISHLVLSACGTSLFASQYGAAIMRYLNAFDSIQTVDASELISDYLPLKGGGLLVASQSGETKDVHRAVLLAEKHDIPRFSVINSVGSLIARTTMCGVYINAGREHAVASTKAFITQVVVMSLIAGWFAQLRNRPESKQRIDKVLDALHKLPVYCGITLKANPNISEIASKIKNEKHIFVLGRGFAEPIAREGALKIKEITYIHAEGYGGGALKHGPFALIEQGTPIILVIPNDENAGLMRTAAEEVRARGARTIIITDCEDIAKGIADDVIVVPENGPLTALLAAVPLQQLAYELAVQRGIDPDKPKNLAKAVTVD